MGSEPARAFGQYSDEKEHGEQKHTLQNDRDPPRIARAVRRKGIVDPIDEIDAKVERRKLHADVQAPVGLWGELGLEDGDGGVDEAHAGAGDDAGDDDVGAGVGGALEEGAEDHDDDARGDAFASTEGFANDGRGDGAEEAADWGDKI